MARRHGVCAPSRGVRAWRRRQDARAVDQRRARRFHQVSPRDSFGPSLSKSISSLRFALKFTYVDRIHTAGLQCTKPKWCKACHVSSSNKPRFAIYLSRLSEPGFAIYPAYKGSTATVRPRFSWNFQDCKIAVWKDTQAPNLLPKFIFTTLKMAFNFKQKTFFSWYNLKPVIIPCRTPKISVQGWNL